MAQSLPSRSLRNFFRKVDVLSGLEGRSLESVIKVLKRETYNRGETLFSEGELGRTMYVLESGEVEVRRSNAEGQPVPIVRLGPGECFGEMALVELEPRSATVVVVQKATVWSLTNLDLWKLFQEDQYAYVIVLQNICRLLSRRLRKADSRIADFLSDRARKTNTAPTRAAAGTRSARSRQRAPEATGRR
ncbi:MAG: cyclic nucleotide-binding domain-containing protein [Myxococcaceae bacterium]|nr:cyclic nucleotide-binding domain-containing protein [Myxococcaceae bacterium]